MPEPYVGVDLGASVIHVVALTGEPPRIAEARTFDATDIDAVVAVAAGAAEVAIDAPAELSTAPHRADESISRKFRTARCGEIALGQEARIWVPWVTPAEPSKIPPWMAVGFDLWRALRTAGHEPVEVYPAGVFRTLAGHSVPSKSTRAGLAARIRLLAPHVQLPETIEMWSHDGIDALGAAVTALHKGVGVARRVAHGASTCDTSAVWLPSPPVHS